MDVVLLLFTFVLQEGHSFFTDLLTSPAKLTWEKSKDYYKDQGGRLLVLDNQENWDFFTAHRDYTDKNLAADQYWIGMKFDDSVLCDANSDYFPWVYHGWGHWSSAKSEPNQCPKQRCIKLKYNRMNTDACHDTHIALCQFGAIDATTITSTEGDMTTTPPTKAEDTASTVPTTTPTTGAENSPSTVQTSIPSTETDMTFSFPTTTDTAGNATSTSTPSTTTTPSDNDNDRCGRCCDPVNNTRQLSQQEQEDIHEALRVQLAVNKTSLSSQKRKLISVYDSRPSSVALGGVACAVLVTVIGMVVVPDTINFCRFISKAS